MIALGAGPSLRTYDFCGAGHAPSPMPAWPGAIGVWHSLLEALALGLWPRRRSRTRMIGGTAPLGAQMMLRAAPATIPAGEVSIVASNLGGRTHELVILPLAAGALAGQRVPGSDAKVPETGSLGEASRVALDTDDRACAAGGYAIACSICTVPVGWGCGC